MRLREFYVVSTLHFVALGLDISYHEITIAHPILCRLTIAICQASLHLPKIQTSLKIDCSPI